MPTTYHSYAPNHVLLLLSPLEERLLLRQLTYFIGDAVDALDLAAFHARCVGAGRRRQPFDPAMMVRALVYAYAIGGILLT